MNAKRIVKSYCQKYSVPPSIIFPLLCPIREYEWLDGWACEMIYSESGFAEEGCVFKTKLPWEEEETIWVMTKQDPENYIVNFVKVTESKVINMQINLTDNKLVGGTDAHFIYTYTGLNEKGNIYINQYVEKEFERSMIRIDKSMNYFLEAGTKLKL